MPPREWRLRIQDILDSIREAQEFTSGVSFEDYQANREKKLAVERCFEIIGEAARHIPPEIEQRYAHVPWKRMRDMRNVISHVYYRVEDPVVWDTLHDDLPPLIPMLQDVLAREQGAEGAEG